MSQHYEDNVNSNPTTLSGVELEFQFPLFHPPGISKFPGYIYSLKGGNYLVPFPSGQSSLG